MILTIICVIIVIIGSIYFTKMLNESSANDIPLVAPIFVLMMIALVGICASIYINADTILQWFKF